MSTLLFPDIPARSLSGRAYQLPHDLEGRISVLIVAFRRWHQSDVDTWVPFLQNLALRSPDLAFYELATISRRYGLARRFIDGGMVAGIRNQEILERTLTTYIDLARLTEPLGIDDTESIQVYAIDANGVIRWHATGPLGPDTLADAGELARLLRVRIGEEP